MAKRRSNRAISEPVKAGRTVSFQEFFDQLCPIVARGEEVAKELRDLMTDMRDSGVNGALMKKWAKAVVYYEATADRVKIDALLNGTEDAVLYARSLGYEVAAAAPERNKETISRSSSPAKAPPYDPMTGEIKAAPTAAPEMPDIPPNLDRRKSAVH